MDVRKYEGSGVAAKERTIFVGGIPLSSTLQQVKDYLSTFDKVQHIQLPRHRDSGILKGYAKAVLATSEGVQRVVSLPFHRIGGLKVGIMQWTNKHSYLKKKDQEGERKVHVRITYAHREKDLLRYFRTYGEVEDLSIRTYPGTTISRNFCYVTFESVEGAKLVLKNSPHLISNDYVYCELSIRPINKNQPENANYSRNNSANEATEYGLDHLHKYKKQFNEKRLQKSEYSDLLAQSSIAGINNQKAFCDFENEITHKRIEEGIPHTYDSHHYSQQPRSERKYKYKLGKARGDMDIHHVYPFKREKPGNMTRLPKSEHNIDESMNSLIKPTSSRYQISSRMRVSRNHYIPGNLLYKVRIGS